MPVSLELSPSTLCLDREAIFAQNGMDWKHFRAYLPTDRLSQRSNCTLPHQGYLQKFQVFIRLTTEGCRIGMTQ